jgi:hypothetical protein
MNMLPIGRLGGVELYLAAIEPFKYKGVCGTDFSTMLKEYLKFKKMLASLCGAVYMNENYEQTMADSMASHNGPNGQVCLPEQFYLLLIYAVA